MKRVAIAAALAMSAALAGCGEDVTPVEAAPEGVIEGMTIENARMVLAPVEGNPAAVYFDLKYDGSRGLTIRRADVEGAASAMLHDYAEYNFESQMMEALPIAITQGTELAFEPGARHIMAFEISPDLKPGDKTEVTLTVSGGGKHTFEAEVKAAGDER